MSETMPQGYKRNTQGHLVPVETIKEIDLARDDLVREIATRAKTQSSQLRDFKAGAMDDIQAFLELSAEKYGVELGGKKGNVTLLSFDGRYKVQRAIAEHLVFDERLQVAKELIDNCIHRWAEGSATEIRALVEHAFQVDKEGKVSTTRILGLRRLDIKDKEWLSAMEAIADSMQVSGSKSYIRVYERIGESDQYRPISLDVAAA